MRQWLYGILVWLTAKPAPPTDRPFSGINFAATFVASNQTCQDGEKSLGHYDTVQRCAMAVWSEGVYHFSYGSEGCFPAPGDCAQGWSYNASLNRYIVDLSGNAKEAWEFQMVKLAAAVYKRAAPGNGWTLAAWAPQGNTSQMGLYITDDECVLVFGGTSHVDDVFVNFNFAPYGACGAQFHTGFVLSTVGEIQRPHWHGQFAPILKGPACNGNVTLVGHSMGGAMATVFAVCANSPDGLASLGVSDVIDLRVKALYTIGAPEVSQNSLRNGKSEDGCFKGSRIYNANRFFHDPVPRLFRFLRYVHPHVNAVMYKEGDSDVERAVYRCGGDSVSVSHQPRPWTFAPLDTNLHFSNQYMYNSARIWR